MVTVSRTSVAVVGGGPAGVVLGLLLARAGIAVRVIEKHDDFNRDFRGDTVHASTIRLLDELGLGDRFRALPQSRLDDFSLPMPDGSRALLGDFSRLRPPYDHVAMVPQWDLLDMLVTAARDEPSFSITMGLASTGTITENGVVTGVHLRPYGNGNGVGDGDDADADAVEELRADVVIACDGRDSVLRSAAGLRPRAFPVPFDTWWFRLPRQPGDAETALVPAFSGTDVLLSFPRPDYHQVAYFAPKGSDAALRAAGIESFRDRVARLRPDFADRVGAIGSMDDVHVLDVRMDRLGRWWRPGLLCIGDAAHAMSPAGGVGINLAVQDAVATASILVPALRRGLRGAGLDGALAAVQRRRAVPAVLVQSAQTVLHRVVFERAFAGALQSGPPKLPVLLARWVPPVRGVYARGIAFGPLPEHAPAWARR
ncbi:FAD-dependent oxidoreductase [Curtobacterium sp. PhB115]|uniref:FAD-dependent oxidoreductase n=1 Tax=Curtobacterium sp. PhB115 TaxID=2485173 RepID=UPI000F4B8AB4|nr:FAD-dependent oxidoreductase [Curtobacterium sp. PhB115]ROP72137.1 2-polyprenyl-6-methoxyphenol hydroxylase-like FAD-dependent oxidoreductase [Curtobacterium sp. PhB115]